MTLPGQPTSHHPPALYYLAWLSESLRHLELARQSNYADTWHWAMARRWLRGEAFLWNLMMARGSGEVWRGTEGGGNYLHPLEDASESSKWAASRGHSYKCQKRAKQIDDKRKRKHSYGRRGGREREGRGRGKTPPLNILIKASSDSACKWPRQGRKWKQTAITKSKAA